MVRDGHPDASGFIMEAFDEVKDFPPVVEGKRAMPVH